MERVRDAILGPREEMTAEKPKWNEKKQKWTGGTAFERDDRAVNLVNGPRCYPLSISYQVPKGMDAPTKGRKVYGRTMDDHVKLTKEILRVRDWNMDR